MGSLSLGDVLRRLLNYVIEGAAVAVAAFVIPQRKMNLSEVALIGLTAAAIFAVLDLFSPTVGFATRQGMGLGLGASMVGFGGVNPIGTAGLTPTLA
jgi:ABC-type Co2+ transport system permease subunit